MACESEGCDCWEAIEPGFGGEEQLAALTAREKKKNSRALSIILLSAAIQTPSLSLTSHPNWKEDVHTTLVPGQKTEPKQEQEHTSQAKSQKAESAAIQTPSLSSTSHPNCKENVHTTLVPGQKMEPKQEQKHISQKKSKKNITGLQSSDFKYLVESNEFIDKTTLIEWVYNMRDPAVVTAPSRFGKSISINMLKRYFEIPVDRNGSRILLESSENYRLFSGTYLSNTTQLAVRSRNFFPHHFGLHPVLVLDFKIIRIKTYESFLRSVVEMCREAMRPFKFLKTSAQIDPEERVEFFAKLKKGGTNFDDVLGILREMPHILSQHFDGMPCLILIDEVDSPIQKILNFKIDQAQQDIIENLIEIMGCLLKSHTQVWKGFCVGQVRFAGLYSHEVNNLEYYPFYKNGETASNYGATHDEVEFLRKQFPENDHLSMKGAEDYYDGYRVKDSSNKTQNYFSTFSVSQYFRFGKLQKYWAAVTSKPFICNMLEITEVMSLVRDSLLGYDITIETKEKLQLEDIVTLKNLIDASRGPFAGLSVSTDNVYLVMQYLLEMGFYTAVDINGYTTLRIPNKEIKELLGESFVTWFIEYFYIGNTAKTNYKNSLEDLSAEPKSQENFVNCTAALFSHSRTMPINSDQFSVPLLYFFIRRFVKPEILQIEYPMPTMKRAQESYLIILKHDKLKNKQTALIIQPAFHSFSIIALKKLTDSVDFWKFHEHEKLTIHEFVLVSLNMNKSHVSGSFLEIDASTSFAEIGTKIYSAKNYSFPFARSKVYSKKLKDYWNYSKGTLNRVMNRFLDLIYRIYPGQQ